MSGRAAVRLQGRSVFKPKMAFVILGLISTAGASLGGCATVAVYEPAASVEIAPSQPQSDLLLASEAYCEATAAKGLASGETNLGSLAGLLTGKGGEPDIYARKVGADRAAPAAVIARMRVDVGETTAGLTRLGAIAEKLMGSTKPTKIDVSQFERALIHARQARDSFADAIAMLNTRAAAAWEAGAELEALDKALGRARLTADDLAAARTSESLARVTADAAAG